MNFIPREYDVYATPISETNTLRGAYWESDSIDISAARHIGIYNDSVEDIRTAKVHLELLKAFDNGDCYRTTITRSKPMPNTIAFRRWLDDY